ncbi:MULTISPECIES: hypothetical protein [unclassified Nostoc]
MYRCLFFSSCHCYRAIGLNFRHLFSCAPINA